MPQIANQDYNIIDFNELPYYEAVERLYRAYLQGTAFDCVVKSGKTVNKIITYEERAAGGQVGLVFNQRLTPIGYTLKAPLATDEGGYLMFEGNPSIYVVSADGFNLKSEIKDGVATDVEVTTEKVENNVPAQYFKEWMIGQSATPK